MSTYFPSPGEIVRKWYVVDADGQTLGRLASQVARVLMGKENPQYTPFLDTGDHVIVINAEKIRTTGVKAEQKNYRTIKSPRHPAAKKKEGRRLCGESRSSSLRGSPVFQKMQRLRPPKLFGETSPIHRS